MEMVPRPFTLEVGGVPVLSFAALSLKEAQSIRREPWLLDDLRSVQSKSAPIWNGKAALKVRAATAAESARFTAAIAGASDKSGELVLAYLVSLDE